MLIAQVVPASAASHECFADVTDALWGGEEAAVVGAVARRRREFTTGRWCARAALSRLGHPPVALPPTPSRAPRWPPAVTGSITHCTGYRAAVVARRAQVGGLGIDAEPARPLPRDVLSGVATPADQAHLHELAAAHPDLPWDRLLFSAKEAVYKLWQPLGGCWLDFQDAEVSFDPEAGTFRAVVLRPPPKDVCPAVEGRWFVGHGLVLTGAACAPPVLVPRSRRGRPSA